MWKQQMLTNFKYRCLDQIVLNKDAMVVGKGQDKYDECNREAIMAIKLSVTDDMFL